MGEGKLSLDLSTIAAPMVNQSDLPFRTLVRRYNTSLVYTQMLVPERLLSDQDYLEFHTRGLHDGLDTPVVVQLCGNDPDIVVKAARTVVDRADAIGASHYLAPHENVLTLFAKIHRSQPWMSPGSCKGSPLWRIPPRQEGLAARGEHGFVLASAKHPVGALPHNASAVSALSHSLPVPVSAKLRLCQNTPSTPELVARLEAAGASWLTLHARHVSSRRRRQGPADLSQVRVLKEHVRIPVVSNGNVRTWGDVQRNREDTGADGVMVGEALLTNPW